ASRQFEWINHYSQLHVATPFARQIARSHFSFCAAIAAAEQIEARRVRRPHANLLICVHTRLYFHRRVPAGRYLAPARPPSYDRARLMVVATGSAKLRTGDSAPDRSILARGIGRTHAAWGGVAGTRRGRRCYHQGTGARDGIVSW